MKTARETFQERPGPVAVEPLAGEPELSLVIPVHNESGAILPLLAEVQAQLAHRLDYEIVVVDDASDDDTYRELSHAKPLLPRLRLVRHAKRRGQSQALVTGIRQARAPWIATLDGDGQNDPADVQKLWGFRHEHPETNLVCGRRAVRRDRWSKRVASRIANAVRGWILHDGVDDTGCGLKLFRRDEFLALPAFDHMHRFLPALMQARGGRIRTVEVNHRPRTAGRSKYGVLDRLKEGLVDLYGVWWLTHRDLGAPVREPVEVEKG